MIGSIRVPSWFQGPTGTGQGGWTSAKLAELVGVPITTRLRAPIPLELDLDVERGPHGWVARHGEAVILEAARWQPDVGDTTPISVEQAREARARFPVLPEDHPVPFCFSCGLQPDSMGVHAGPLGDRPERYATDWTAPAWAVGPGGTVDPAVVWAALDCTAAWYACCHPVHRRAITAQFAAQVLRPVEPGEELALVSWSGDGPGDWDGRKRTAASAAFDRSGAVVARARSFWVALTEPGRLT